MRTNGAYEDLTIPAACKASLWSYLPAVVCPCCCTFCCTRLTCKPQSSSARLPSDHFSSLALASSSRSQVAPRAASVAACLACGRPSVRVRWCPPLSVAIVTHFVTQSLASRSWAAAVRNTLPKGLRRLAGRWAGHDVKLIESAQDGLKISSEGLDNCSVRPVMEGSRNDPGTLRP